MRDSATDKPEMPETLESRGTVLVVDDTPANLTLLSHILARHGYHVRPIPDGALALAAVRADPPDLILLDIRMPEMDGYQVCERLKADARTRDIPIIFISALDATEDKVRAFRAGGVDYVTKPFQAAEVVARVDTHLSMRALQKQLVEANQKMAQELSLAGEVQASFLRQDLPAFAGWQLSAALLPAREASGDFYDVISLPQDRLGIVMADVSDKGVGAALFMALSCTLMRTFARHHPSEPATVLAAVNRRILSDTKSGQFVTLFYGILEPATGRLVYGNAGHPPPLLFRAGGDGGAEELEGTGLPLGLFEDWPWGQESVQIDPGDVLVLYTDGITEAHSEQRELFGKERLLASVSARLQGGSSPSSGPPKAGDVQATILADVEQFAGRAPRSDDITLAVVIRGQDTQD